MINYSFIIPHKNCPDLLRRCVNSIPVRDDVQIIVVDDNSDEGKKPSLPERKGLEVVLLDASQSKGAGRARNVGLTKAEGKWLLFPDSDDYYVSSFMDVLDRYKESDADAVYFGAEYRDGKTGEKLKNLHFMDEIENYDGSTEGLETVRFHHNAPWTKMVSHAFVETINVNFEESLNGNDILFSILIGFWGKKFLVERGVLYVYVKNSGSLVTEKKFDAEKKLCRIIQTIQHNQFLSYIHHPEWKVNIIKQILYEIKQTGYKSTFAMIQTLFKNQQRIKRAKNEWVLMLEQRK